MDDKPQIALVTGAASGIGRAIALALAREGCVVYASMRDTTCRNAARTAELQELARIENVALFALELDVLSETACRAAVDYILGKEGRLDIVVNNAGMLMQGITESFSIDQVARIIDTNALSWLRVNRAVLPTMRRQGHGLLMYVGSTTARLHEPFLGPYVASKAAGDALAEIMGMEVRPFGIESVTLVPGAFTTGTEHFSHTPAPAYETIAAQYADLPSRMATLKDRLNAIDAANDGGLRVEDVGRAACQVAAMPRGARPSRFTIDGQRKGTDAIDAVCHAKQSAFLDRLGLADLAAPAPWHPAAATGHDASEEENP